MLELEAGLIDALPISVAMRDTECRFVLVNRTWESYFAIRREDALGKRFCELPGWQGNPELERVAREAEKLDREVFARGPGAQPVILEDVRLGRSYVLGRQLYTDASGRVAGVLATGVDTSELRAVQQALAAQVKFTNDVFDSVPLALAMRDPQGKYLFINRTWEKYFDASRERVIGRSVHDTMAPEDAERLLAEDRRALERGPGGVQSVEFHYGGKALLQTRTVMADEQGKVLGVLVATLDVTERRATEQQLRDQMALTQAIVERMPNAVFLKDPQGRFTMVNAGWSQMSGIQAENAVGKTVHEIYPPELARRFAEEDDRLLAGEISGAVEALHHGPRPDQWRIVRKTLLTREDGTLQGLISTSTDVSELKRAEAQLADRARFVSDMVDALPISLAMRDLEGRYQLVNRAWERYFGISREAVIGKRRSELPGAGTDPVRATDATRIEAADRELLERGPDFEPEPRPLDRLGRSYLITSRLLAGADGRPRAVLSAGLDVTERHAMEAALELEKRRLDLVVRGSRAGIVDWNGHTHETYYSPRFREILGHAADADTSQWPDYFKVLLHPDDRERFTRRWQAFIRGKGPEGPRGEFLGPDEHRLQRKDGSYVWVEVNGIATRDENGFVTRWIAATTDITERRAQEEELKKSVRLREEVERMSRHDLKTPMNSVIAMSRLLREGGTLQKEDEALLASIERAGFRIVNMVNLSLDLFRMESGSYDFRPRAVDLAEVARRVAEDLRSQAASKGVAIVVEEIDPQPARAEELLCYSMLANLVKNAIEAAPDASAVTITAEGRGETTLAHVHNLGAVPPAIRARFFDKYQSVGKSAGLGLGTYSARLMARVQDGDITLNTSDADGTTISVRLRAAAERAVSRENRSEERAQEHVALEKKRVLVVDDDEFNRMVMQRLLPVPPLEVEVAVNGRAALEAARRAWPDVIFLDLEMPVMDGYEAAKALRALEREKGDTPGRRRCTLVAVSSNDEDVIVARALEAGCDHYIVKPPAREALLRVLAGRAPLPSGGTPAPEARPGDPVELDPDLEAGLPAFLKSRRDALDEMPAALARGDRVAFRRLAHKLAGSFALYGFRYAAAQCRALEQDAPEGAAADLEARARKVRSHLDQVTIRAAVKQ